MLREDGIELPVIFGSSDRDAAAFDEYFATMPWCTFPHGDPRIEALKSKYQADGIPWLVVLDVHGKTWSSMKRTQRCRRAHAGVPHVAGAGEDSSRRRARRRHEDRMRVRFDVTCVDRHQAYPLSSVHAVRVLQSRGAEIS